MSLETAIQENTAVMRELIAALGVKASPAGIDPSKPTSGRASSADKPKEIPAPEAKTETAKPDVAALRKEVTEIIGKGVTQTNGMRPKVVAVLTEYKAAKSSEVPDEKFAEFADKIKALFEVKQ